VVSSRFIGCRGEGGTAPARLFCAALALGVAGLAAPAAAQQPTVSAPDQTETHRLIWSSLAALDHANRTGNYSVLRDLGAPSFQAQNSAANLAGIFQVLRAQQIDLSYALIVAPNFDFPPAVIEGGLLRARGNFPLRPYPIGFDLLYQRIDGEWRLFGMAVVPLQPPAPHTQPPRR
jgi:hypothetical protein